MCIRHQFYRWTTGQLKWSLYCGYLHRCDSISCFSVIDSSELSEWWAALGVSHPTKKHLIYILRPWPITRLSRVVPEAGFEPAVYLRGRFWVCCVSPISPFRHKSSTNYQRTKLTYSFNINILYHNIDILYTKIGPPDGIRTHTSRILSSMPLPIGLQEVKWSANWESNPDLLNHNQVY